MSLSSGSSFGFGSFGGGRGILRASKAFAYGGDDDDLGRLLRVCARKDGTTKRRALEELAVALGDSGGRTSANLRACLPAWLFLYGELLHDGDYRVRRRAHVVKAFLLLRITKATLRQHRYFGLLVVRLL